MEQNIHPSIPAHQRLYAIGDVHGCPDLLRQLLAIIDADAVVHKAETYQIVLLGDYIGRGPDSRGVLDLLLRRERPSRATLIILRGNLEERVLRFLDGDDGLLPKMQRPDDWQTAASYGVPAHLQTTQDSEALRQALRACIPAEHLAFMRALPLYFEWGDYVFVHAGVHPGKPLNQQTVADLIETRYAPEDFRRASQECGRTIVHGHTPGDKSYPHRVICALGHIGLDTNFDVSGGCLTALALQERQQSFLHVLRSDSPRL